MTGEQPTAPPEFRAIYESFMWQPVIDGRTHDVPISVVRHADALGVDQNQVHLYPGFGEERKAAYKGVRILGEEGLHAVGVILPFDCLPPEPANFDRVITEVPHAIAEAYNVLAENPADRPVSLVGNSQGAGAALRTAGAAPEKFDIIAALAPPGLNPETFAGEQSERVRKFLVRIGVTNALFRREQSFFTDFGGNVSALSEIGGRAINDWRGKRLAAKLDFALGIELADTVKSLVEDHGVDLRVFVGEHDPVFKIEEVQPVLAAVGMAHVLELIPGSHGTVHNKGGRRQLRHAARWVKYTRDINAAA